MLFYYMPPCDFTFKNINDCIFELYDNSILISSLHLSKENPYYIIDNFYINEQYKGYGCFRYLVHRAIDIHRHIISTLPELFKYWRVLNYYPHFSFTLKLINDNIISDITEHSLWFSDGDILIQKVFYTEDNLKIYEKNQQLKQRCNRDDHTILYGPYSSGKWAYNP